jgi:hypothetical protein
MNPNVKANINQIDFDLKNLFENVFIIEKTSKDKYLFEIKVDSIFLFESDKKRVGIRIDIDKNDMTSNNIRWTYYTNPLLESSDKIERISHIDMFANDVMDIATNKRMVTEYFDALESIVDKINESYTEVEVSISDKVKSIVSSYITVSDISTYLVENKNFNDAKTDYKIKINHIGEIKISDKFKIEQNINANPLVNYTIFREGYIEVDYTK